MINVKRIPDSETGGFITMFDMQNVVDVNPAYYYAQIERYREIEKARDILMLKGIRMSAQMEKIYANKALKGWQERYQNALAHQLPDQLKGLFDGKKKKHLSLLKDFEMSSADWFAFIIQAWDTYGYKYSMYKFSHRPKELEGAKYPKFIFKQDDDRIVTDGKTNLSQKQLKLALTERREMIINFFTKDEKWHCFFRTYKSIFGHEKAHVGEPHMHYLSNAWGYSKADVLHQLSERKHHLQSAHIWYEKREDEID